jgi:hypothetical protein
MDVVGGVRKLLQDLIVPELRELSARMKALEDTMSTRMQAVEETTSAKLDTVNFKLDTIIKSFQFDERLKKVEEHQKTAQ